MRLSLIVAVSRNNVIGVAGGLPWHLPEDLRRFKTLTMGKPMIMGRSTCESIGCALPGRRSIVLSRRSQFEAAGCEVVASVPAAIEAAGNVPEIMVIGGGHVYRAFLPLADRIYLTCVDAEIAGDTFFPQLDKAEWTLTDRDVFAPQPERQYGFSIDTLDRVSKSP